MKNIIPDFILKQYVDNKFKGNFRAVAMFLDISGFTPMTEELMKNGKEGVEILSDIISNIFSPAIEIVHSNGGFISTFAGDAFTAIFPLGKSKNNELISNYLLLTKNIRLAFKKVSYQKTKFGNYDLSLKLGISLGNVDWGIIINKGKLYYYFKGNVIDNSAENQKDAVGGEIIFDEFIRKHIDNSIIISEVKDKNNKTYKLVGTKQKKLELFHKSIGKEDKLLSNKFTKCIHRSILNMTTKGEFRKIISCVISFSAVKNWENFISEIISMSEEYGGYFNKIDFGDKGGLVLILFGAPHASEDIYSRACDFAIAVRSLKEFDTKPIIGITFGMAFTGFVGSERRCDYTAIGTVVNKAVRYLNRAQSGDVLIDTSIYEKKKNDLIIEIFQGEQFKGFSDKTTFFKIIRKKEKIKENIYLSSFVGRNKEKDRLFEYVKKIFDNRFGGFIYIDGNAGIGKTRLILEVKRILLSNKILNLPYGTNNWFFLPCDPILKKV